QGSNSVTGLTTTIPLFVGESVSGAHLPSGTIVTQINSTTAITVSNAATASLTEPLTFIGSLTGDITDAGPGTPNVPATTTFTADVEINPATAPGFTTVSNLSLTLNLVHPHLDQVQIQLIAPDGTVFTILQNHVDAAGSTTAGKGLATGVNFGVYNGYSLGTVLDDGANRSLIDGANKDPHVGLFVPEYQGNEDTFTQALD